LLFPTSYGSRIPITINGNQLADFNLGSILNSSALDISLDLLERVEIISGQPSSLYGTNAILGTINIVPRAGKDFDGGVVAGGIDMEGKKYANFVAGNKFENGIDIIASYKFSHFTGYDIYFEEYDETSIYGDTTNELYNPRVSNKGIADHKNNSQTNSAFLSGSYDNFKLTAL
jgi:outer membrane receptor protein involved in Fe transport